MNIESFKVTQLKNIYLLEILIIRHILDSNDRLDKEAIQRINQMFQLI